MMMSPAGIAQIGDFHLDIFLYFPNFGFLINKKLQKNKKKKKKKKIIKFVK